MLGDGEDTIAALATAKQPAAVAVLRISGPRAFEVAEDLAPGLKRKMIPRKMMVSWLIDKKTGEKLDQALVVFFPGPDSYSGQDMVELHCHGGLAVVERVFGAVLAAGARPAEPGEFTLRAFLAGKLDLSQAEAVGRLVEASSQAAARAAVGNLAGGLGQKVRGMVESLRSLRVELEAAVEFPDEDFVLDEGRLGVGIGVLEEGLESLLADSVDARLVYEGLRVALVGRANVGKSSLFNELLGKVRAVVHKEAGTTRDYLSERVSLSGVLVELLDTAGERDSIDEVECEAGRIGREAVDGADLVVVVVDGSRSPEEEDRAVWNRWKERDRLLVVNKADLGIRTEWSAWVEGEPLVVSAVTREGLGELKERIVARVGGEKGGLVVEARQRGELMEAAEALGRARSALESGGMLDVVGTELSLAEGALKRVLGHSVDTDVLNQVFGRFCVGK